MLLWTGPAEKVLKGGDMMFKFVTGREPVAPPAGRGAELRAG